MEQKVRICLQFSNPNQGGGPPSSANPLQILPAPAAPPTTTAADVSDQHEPAFLFRWRALRHHQHHHRRRTFLVTNDAARGTNTNRVGTALPKRRRQLHRQTNLYPVAITDTSTVLHPRALVSLYFSPLFLPCAPFRSVRRVCRTTCPSWPRMHLSNGETNW